MEEVGIVKRKRSPNWWPSEKKLLVDLVEEHLSVLENKRTDALTMRKKKAEWEIVAQAYNSSTSLGKRSAENLKAAWENLKKNAKKDLANSQIKDFKTDSGPSKDEKEDFQYHLYARVIELLLKLSATRLSNCNGNNSDQIVQEVVEGLDGGANQNITESELVKKKVAEERVEVLMNDDWSPSLRPDVVTVLDITSSINSNTFLENENAEVEEGTEKSLWSDYTPNKAPCLNKRPLPAAADTSLEKLYQSKIAALELQMKHAIEEREEARKLHAVEVNIKKFQLKQEKLKLKILMLQMKEQENK